ncbi:MAG: PD-(D/E)XK nuclease family protein [Gammaproteobacteria bacterium]|nr:PD-(D/E)XK nuclease family protein [Gammaproteobacteria bacterium]
MNTPTLNDLLSLYSDRSLHELQGKLNVFNPFDVLRIKEHEIRHTNVLSWLFDPYENHGFDDFFLKQFILRVLGDRNEHQGLIAQTIRANGLKARCHREYRTDKGRSIDVLIVIENLSLVLLVENKIKSSEHGNQLASYLDSIRKKYSSDNADKEYTVIPVYLTLEGDEPSDPRYSGASYELIIELIKDSLAINSGVLPEQKVFIESYINTLENVVGQANQELIKVAEEIYAVHRKAIDFIVQAFVQDSYAQGFQQFIEQSNEFVIKVSRNNFSAFTTMAFESVNTIPVDRWFIENGDRPICIEFYKCNERKLGIAIVVGPITDREIRKRLLDDLEEAGFKFQKNARNEKSKFTRFYSEYEIFEALDSVEEVCQAMNKLYSQSLAKIRKAEEVLVGFSNSL